MRRSKFTEAQIVFALRQAEEGVKKFLRYVERWVSARLLFTIGRKNTVVWEYRSCVD